MSPRCGDLTLCITSKVCRLSGEFSFAGLVSSANGVSSRGFVPGFWLSSESVPGKSLRGVGSNNNGKVSGEMTSELDLAWVRNRALCYGFSIPNRETLLVIL